MGLKWSASGSLSATALREGVRWVLKAPFEVLGRGGCISSRSLSFGGREEAGGVSALGNEEDGAAAGDRASNAGILDGGEEGT